MTPYQKEVTQSRNWPVGKTKWSDNDIWIIKNGSGKWLVWGKWGDIKWENGNPPQVSGE
jgi:hypothetical protein